jgi:uncharacterized protein
VRVLPVLFAALTLAAPPRAATPQSPVVPARPARYVTDLTGRVPAARVSALNEKLAAFERLTSTQVLVYVDSRVPAGTTLDEFANLAFRQWGIGQKGKDNGVLFVAFLDDRVMRLEVGYGLEGALPDARAKQITSDYVKPRFKAGDYAGGLEAAADQILTAARGEAYQGTGRTVAEGGSMPLFAKLFFSLFGWVLAAAFFLGVRSAWRETRTQSRVARWSTRMSLVSWTLLVSSPLIFLWWSRFPPLALLLGLAHLALACRIVAIAAGQAGFRRVFGIVGRVGFMAALALVPRAFDTLTTGVADYRVLYAMGGGIVLGLASLVRPGSGRRGVSVPRQASWGSADASWSSTSSTSSSSYSESSPSSSSGSSSSSDYSGGGGSSGGGGASDSW